MKGTVYFSKHGQHGYSNVIYLLLHVNFPHVYGLSAKATIILYFS